MRRRLNLGVGSLLLMAFMLILMGIIFHMSGVNLLFPVLQHVASFFVIANTCLLMALIVDKFDRPHKNNK